MKIFEISKNGCVGMRDENPKIFNSNFNRIWELFGVYEGTDREGLLKELNSLNTERDYYLVEGGLNSYNDVIWNAYEKYTDASIHLERWTCARGRDILEQFKNPSSFPAICRIVNKKRDIDIKGFFTLGGSTDTPRKLHTEQGWKDFAINFGKECEFKGFNTNGNFFEIEVNFVE